MERGVGKGGPGGDQPVEGPPRPLAEERKAGGSVLGAGHWRGVFHRAQRPGGGGGGGIWGSAVAGARGLGKVHAGEEEWSRDQGLTLAPTRGVSLRSILEEETRNSGDRGGEERGTSSGLGGGRQQRGGGLWGEA